MRPRYDPIAVRRIAPLLLVVCLSCIPDKTLILPSMVEQCEGEVPKSLRIASYNVKSGAETSLTQVREVISGISADVVALQEVNVNVKKGGEADQVGTLGHPLGYQSIYAATLSRGGIGTYGIGLLTRLPVKSVRRIELAYAQGAAEPRVAIDAIVCAGHMPIRIIATHADVWRPAPDIKILAAELGEETTTPTILLGDLNVKPNDPAVEWIASKGLTDLIGKYSEGPTFWSRPKRLDYLFVNDSLAEKAVGASIGTIKASDHYPVWADFNFP
jgi:endonuclease/exonuclease/phosphatase family metal-dependent hydrolase